ncbi:hypothetical protein [Bradyrhizobium sp. RT3a]|uniref:hypothetical protein n=1 Tax=Bradyrhizobium sp. RT3a TaxID=3156333 RepID=UPI003391374D
MSKKSRAKESAFQREYTGELATPIYEPVAAGAGGLFGDKAEAERRTAEQRISKMEQLFNWYSIDPDEPDAWMFLAVQLAAAHVPGMQVRHVRKRGRKRTWKDGLGIELVHDVAALQQTKKKMSYVQAIKELHKRRRWSAYTVPNLVTRHREARKVEERRLRLAEQLKASPVSQAMGAVFGVGLTDENSEDQN